MQLQMGHTPLNSFLHRIGKVSSPLCPACLGADKTVHHLLFDCPTHAYARHSLARKLERWSKSIQYLLGNQKAFNPVLKFIHEMGQFKDTLSDLSIASL